MNNTNGDQINGVDLASQDHSHGDEQPQPEPPPVRVALNRQVQVVPGFANIFYYTRMQPNDTDSSAAFVGSIELRVTDVQAAEAMLRDAADFMAAQLKAMADAAQQAAARALANPGPEGARMLAAVSDARQRGFKGFVGGLRGKHKR